jgi:alpha-tubulin suppressor-like RCC1 family protein
MDRWVPTPVQGLSSGVQAVAAGDSHTCAMANGAAYCWGWNAFGQVGDNTTMTDRLSPVPVQGLSSGVQAITAGDEHSCALTSAGAKCWGANGTGQLGNNSMADSAVPVPVQGL